MKYKVNKNTHPVYLQIYKQIKEDIINGYYPYNTKLPSKRLLADETDTSTVTIEHAYALLCDEAGAHKSSPPVLLNRGDFCSYEYVLMMPRAISFLEQQRSMACFSM